MANKSIDFAGGNNITLSTATAASITSITISGPNTHAQQTAISGIVGSDASYTSGTVQFTGSNMVTVKSSAGQRIVIDATQTVQTQNAVDLTLSGNTAGVLALVSSGTATLAGGNNITLSQVGNAVTVSGPNTHAQQTAISGIANSETTYTSGTVSLSDLANITIRSTTGNQYQFSVHAPETPLSVGVSTGGNTAGNTTVNTGSRLVFSGQSNITLSQATAAGATTIGISAPDAGAGGGFSAGVSNLGDTAGSTGVTGTRVVFVGTDGQTLSQSTNSAGATITFDPGPRLGYWVNAQQDPNATPISTQGYNGKANSFLVHPMVGAGDPFPGMLTANTFGILLSHSGSTATMSQANSSSFYFAVYTSNASTLSILNSVSTSWGNVAATDNSTSTAGIRWLTIHSSQWSSSPFFSRGRYWIGFMVRTSSLTNQTFAIPGQHYGDTVNAHIGTMGAASTAVNTMGWIPLHGWYGTTTTAPPASIASTDLRKDQGLANWKPLLVFNENAVQSF